MLIGVVDIIKRLGRFPLGQIETRSVVKKILRFCLCLLGAQRGLFPHITIEPNHDAVLEFSLESRIAREFDADESKRQSGKKVSAVDGLILKVFVAKIEILFPVILTEIVLSCAKVIADVAELNRLVGYRHFHGFKPF